MSSTVTRFVLTPDSGTASAPVGDGALFDNDFLQAVLDAVDEVFSGVAPHESLELGGTLTVEGFGTHSFEAGDTGGNLLAVRNTSGGTTNYSGLHLGNDAAGGAAQFILTASNYTTNAPYYQDALTVQSARTGGLNIAATHASGVVRFTAGGNAEDMRLSATGGLSIGDTTDPGAGGLRLHVGATNAGMTVTDGTVTGVVFASEISTVPCMAIGTQSNHPLYFGANNAFPLMGLDTGGKLTIGAQTGNAFMTVGLTVNQGANDDKVVSLQSDDVAHGMTSLATANTFSDFCKTHPTQGGVTARGFSTTTGAGVTVLGAQATPDTAKSTAANGAVNINGGAQSGTGITTLGSNGNILTLRDNGSTQFVFDAEGDGHCNSTAAWTTYDGEDDTAVLNLLTAHLTRPDDPLRAGFGHWLEQSREPLERLRLVTFNEDGSRFLCWTRLLMLHTGAIRQLASALANTRLELEAIQRRLALEARG